MGVLFLLLTKSVHHKSYILVDIAVNVYFGAQYHLISQTESLAKILFLSNLYSHVTV